MAMSQDDFLDEGRSNSIVLEILGCTGWRIDEDSISVDLNFE